MTEQIILNEQRVCIYCVLEMMRRRGGDFVRALQELWWRADPINKEKVIRTFEEYFNQYAADVVREAARCRHA